jgi:hypothetical protein
MQLECDMTISFGSTGNSFAYLAGGSGFVPMPA